MVKHEPELHVSKWSRLLDLLLYAAEKYGS